MNGNMMRRMRVIKGIKPEEIADYLNMSYRDYANLELGRRHISNEGMFKYCNLFEINPSQFFGFEKIKIDFEHFNAIDGETIRKMRLIKGLSVDEISDYLNISRTKYRDVEYGRTVLSTKCVPDYCKLFGFKLKQPDYKYLPFVYERKG